MDTKSNTKIGFSSYLLSLADNQKNGLKEQRGRALAKFAKNEAVLICARKI